MRVYLDSLGCKLNQSEIEALAHGFVQAGHHLVQTGEEADLCVVNTCTVTQVADKKSRQLIRRLRRVNPTARLSAYHRCSSSGRCRPRQPLANALAGEQVIVAVNVGEGGEGMRVIGPGQDQQDAYPKSLVSVTWLVSPLPLLAWLPGHAHQSQHHHAASHAETIRIYFVGYLDRPVIFTGPPPGDQQGWEPSFVEWNLVAPP